MNRWTRRKFTHLAGAACLVPFSPRVARGQAKARVVVVGGGVGGATVAKYLAASEKGLDVTLVEPKPSYTTCFFSNLYLAGLRSLESLTHSYETLAQKYGITVIHDTAEAVDPVAKVVALKNGTKLGYDRAVVAPGIAFRYSDIEGYDEAASESLPHAWNAGPQTKLLREQLESMDNGGVFVITAPPNPFRCPPGPYERASLIAYYFKQFKPRAKILILDSKDSFFEQDLFQDAWSRHYPGMIEWLPGQFTGGIQAVDVKGRVVKTAGGTFKAAVANIIPPQMAGELARRAGLVDQSGWCPIDPLTFESKLQPGIYVVGDATSAGDMPKSAFVTNSQAKVCAFAIATALAGSEAIEPHLFNTCFTFLAADDAVSDAISFKATAETIKISEILLSAVGEDAELRRQVVRTANGWYDAFTHDVFG
ncbi:MAG: NAD(P)/FAD-dependent oxidoreductase [Mesorhizobium sp.]|uniref:FAD-dependent oxidoreductase n=2 Tax=unclassified Mesorhizobium TaxID=325217 RepID=UPI001201B94E|nr:FAD-dependent oxidoreductase [Mesorhizobium sp.]TIS53459.1 MAG: NAD(P)/FAD-dependent oxidoreductase [Mesorhizobium sp.]